MSFAKTFRSCLSFLSFWVGVTILLALAGCVAGGVPGAGSTFTPTPVGDRQDLVTASDETPAARSARIRIELAAEYYSQGQYTTALDEVKRALLASPNSVGAYNMRGLIYGAMGEQALADDSFRRALQFGSDDGDTRHNYGWYLCGQRRYAEAFAQFGAALALPRNRDAAKTWSAQGVCQARSGDLVSAEKSLKESYALDPVNPGTAFNLAELMARRGDLERARFYISRVNAQPQQVTADSLWLALRIDRKLGHLDSVQALGRQLRERFPTARQAAAFERGQFDE